MDTRQSAAVCLQCASISNKALIRYDTSCEIKLARDVSSYNFEPSDGWLLKKIIAFLSCTLMKDEQDYTQIEKDGRTIIFSVQNAHLSFLDKLFLSVMVDK